MPFGINGVDRLLAAFEALFNERKHRPILVIVAVEKTAYMRPADHCVTEPNRTDALSELSRANGLVVGRMHRAVLFYCRLRCLFKLGLLTLQIAEPTKPVPTIATRGIRLSV